MRTDTLKQRIHRIRIDHGMFTQNALSRAIGMPLSTLQKIISRGEISSKNIERLRLIEPHLSLEWLLYNKGPMRMPGDYLTVLEQNERMRLIIDTFINTGNEDRT